MLFFKIVFSIFPLCTQFRLTAEQLCTTVFDESNLEDVKILLVTAVQKYSTQDKQREYHAIGWGQNIFELQNFSESNMCFCQWQSVSFPADALQN